jgi:hypothetical protein
MAAFHDKNGQGCRNADTRMCKYLPGRFCESDSWFSLQPDLTQYEGATHIKRVAAPTLFALQT